MARKSTQEITFSSDKARQRKIAAHKKRMPIVRCVRGFGILLVPDLKAMNHAIKNQLVEHKQASSGLEGLTAFLTEQVLIVASKNVSVKCKLFGHRATLFNKES